MPTDPALAAAASASEDYWGRAETLPIVVQWTAEEARAYVESELAIGPARDPAEVLRAIAKGFDNGTLHLQHPGYYGLFNPGVTPVSAAADLLVAAYNPQLAAWSHGGVAIEAERHVLRHFAKKLGLPESTHAFFASGGQEANQSALLCALADRLPGYTENGLTARPAIYVSSEGHHSFHKAAKACGIGLNAVREIEVDDRLRMRVDALEARVLRDIEEGFVPVMAVATFGTTGAGAIDPVDEVAAVCRKYGLWFHVDAAWAAAVCLSPSLRGLASGFARADSLTWDAHKWLQVPMGAGMFFCTKPEAAAEAFSIGTAYMPPSVPGGVDGYDSSPQWSRRAIGIKVLAQVATLGDDGLAELVDGMTRVGNRIRSQVSSAGWTLLNDTPLPLVCFTHPTIESGTVGLEDVLACLYQRGRSWVSKISLSTGRVGFRACVTNALTTEAHVDELVNELGFALDAAKKGQ